MLTGRFLSNTDFSNNMVSTSHANYLIGALQLFSHRPSAEYDGLTEAYNIWVLCSLGDLRDFFIGNFD